MAMMRPPRTMKTLFRFALLRLRREPNDLAGIHDVERVERALDRAHHLDGRSRLLLEIGDLPLADAVLARAGAVHGDGALGESPDQRFCGTHLGGAIRV